MSTKIAVTGCCGRMGKRIISLALLDGGFEIVGVSEAKGHPDIGKNLSDIINEEGLGVEITDDLSVAAKDADVIIDFTLPEATSANLAVAKDLKVPIVIGTTGLSKEQIKDIDAASNSVAILFSSNMSLGVNTLFRLAPEVAKALGDDYNIEIIEIHHNKKKDSPSGTAMTLAGVLADAKNKDLKDLAVYGREGNAGERSKNEIGIHAVRAGSVVGEHTVIYAGEYERIEITHRASSRDVFVKGALRAAEYIKGKKLGLYNMQNVIKGA